MKKQLEMLRHFNLMDEAMFLLYQWVNKGELTEAKPSYSGVTEVKSGNSEEAQLNIEKEHKKLELANEIFNEVKEAFADRKERIDYYFKERNMEFSTLSALALLWKTNSFENKLVTYEERMEGMTQEQRTYAFADIISDEEVVTPSEEELSTLPALIAYIDESAYDKEARWEVIKIFNNQKPYYDEVYNILSEVIQLISSRHGDKLAKLEEEFYAYWSECHSQYNIIDLINDRLKITWNCDNGTIVMPLLFLPYGIIIHLNEPEKKEKDIIRIGLIINKDLITNDKKINTEDVVEAGKLLSDKSKVDIMKYISKRPSYGKELANELGLSTATISYHVNALLRVGFVKADISSNKVYYSLDMDRISSYLEDIKNFFTET